MSLKLFFEQKLCQVGTHIWWLNEDMDSPQEGVVFKIKRTRRGLVYSYKLPDETIKEFTNFNCTSDTFPYNVIAFSESSAKHLLADKKALVLEQAVLQLYNASFACYVAQDKIDKVFSSYKEELDKNDKYESLKNFFKNPLLYPKTQEIQNDIHELVIRKTLIST